MDFHIDLAALSGNQFLTRAVRDAMRRLSRARWIEMRDDAGRARAWAEHHEILAATERGDGDASANLLARHIDASRDRLLATLRDDRRGLAARGVAIRAA